MRKIFWGNPYQDSLITTVLAVDGNELLFEETIAFSFSGGQESDLTYINDLPIVTSRIEGNFIYYQLPENHGLMVGDIIKMRIDWPRRYRLMRLHFAAELILELVTQHYHLEKIGAHIAETKARIDFMSENNIKLIFPELLTEYNKIIQQDLIIHTGFSDIKDQRRFWRIDGFAEVPCGGTHVKSTAEVGLITLKREHPGKGIERIEIRLNLV